MLIKANETILKNTQTEGQCEDLLHVPKRTHSLLCGTSAANACFKHEKTSDKSKWRDSLAGIL